MTRRRLMVDPSELAIIVIDVQPYFLDGWMTGASEPLLARLEFLLALATVYDLPLLATFEQPIEKKGWLPERLEPFFPAHGQRHTKQTFNCCGEASIVEAIAGLGRSQIALAGAETDVCVLQSTLGLIEAGKQVFLLEDALFSSEPHVGPALRRMEQAGAIPSTVKALSYELRRSVATPPPEQVFAQHAPGLTLPEPETFPVWAS
ncbi:MAG: isochorismatase family protein, partial [Chloroflexota bacterium]|nr:isochorismatase family protein [Chloroflexota bacterium]